MRISRHQVICGVPAFDLRAAFRRLSYGWTALDLAGLLKASEEEAEEILGALVAEGFAEPDLLFGGQYFRLTLRGGALAEASALKPVQRRKADELVAEAVERAKQINADDRELYQVSRLWVFGSYLTDAEELGDVDLAFELSRKGEWPPSPHGERLYSKTVPLPKGWSRSPLEVMAWPHEAVVRRLKGKRRHLSLHPSTDDVLTTAQKREIFAA